MKLFSVLALVAGSFAASNRSIGWYMPPHFDSTFVRENLDVVDRINLCCSQINVLANGTMEDVNGKEYVTNRSKEMHSLGVEFVMMGSVDEQAILSKDSVKAVDDIVSYVKYTKSEGIIFDYEPKNKFTDEHASKYEFFLSAVKKASNNEFYVGMDVSGWGILNKFPIYAPSKLDIYTSMATTYYMNSAVTPEGHQFVSNMTSFFGKSSRFGIGSTATMSTGQHCSYNWTAPTLAPYLDQLPYRAVDIYPCDFDHRGTLDPSFLEVFKNW